MKSAIKVAYEESKLASGATVDDSGELGVGYMAHSHECLCYFGGHCVG
jgi:hypothetical protein